MRARRGFDRLARSYRALEYAAFGRDLERARFAHLARLSGCRSILVLGEGDGRCLERLVEAAPQARVDCLDVSAAMLARAAARLAGRAAAGRGNFHQTDVRGAAWPGRDYDAVVTFFFLDCFTEAEAAAVMASIGTVARAEAVWLWADFVLPPEGWARVRARMWLAVLYAFFRWQTGLGARSLPAVRRIFVDLGWTTVAELSWQHGFARSAVLRRLDGPRNGLVTGAGVAA